MPVALIDADIICYAASSIAQNTIDWGDGDGGATHLSPDDAAQAAVSMADSWTKLASAKQAVLVLSDRSKPAATFRYRVKPDYKHERKEGDRPELLDYVRRILRASYDTITWDGLEGDDVIGILMTGEDGSKYTTVSYDKDMRTIPGLHCDPRKKKKHAVRVSPEQANWAWAYQVLVGDIVDGYTGIPGVGKKKAPELLAGLRSVSELWQCILECAEAQYKKPGSRKAFGDYASEEYALMQARLAYILRSGDYKMAKGNRPASVRLWTPPGYEDEWLELGDDAPIPQQPEHTEGTSDEQ